jgi:trehalose 6-phosphate phosphatase
MATSRYWRGDERQRAGCIDLSMSDDAFSVLTGIDLIRAAMLFDVDGTLIDIGPSPFEVDVPQDLKNSLSRLLEKTAGALALVSGRPIRDLDRLFDPLQLPAIGGHGAETRLHAGQASERTADIDSGLRQRLIEATQGDPRLLYEDKGYSVALHFRKAPEQEETLQKHVQTTLAAFPNETVEVLPGKAMIEVKRPGVSKGQAVRALMQRTPFKGRMPVFIGDDVTDESVFAVMPALSGVNFSVSRQFSEVQHVFSSPADVRRALAVMAAT